MSPGGQDPWAAVRFRLEVGPTPPAQASYHPGNERSSLEGRCSWTRARRLRHSPACCGDGRHPSLRAGRGSFGDHSCAGEQQGGYRLGRSWHLGDVAVPAPLAAHIFGQAIRLPRFAGRRRSEDQGKPGRGDRRRCAEAGRRRCRLLAVAELVRTERTLPAASELQEVAIPRGAIARTRAPAMCLAPRTLNPGASRGRCSTLLDPRLPRPPGRRRGIHAEPDLRRWDRVARAPRPLPADAREGDARSSAAGEWPVGDASTDRGEPGPQDNRCACWPHPVSQHRSSGRGGTGVVGAAASDCSPMSTNAP